MEWVAGAVPQDFHTDVVSDVPALLVSGALDPVTPPESGEAVAARLGNSLHLVVPFGAHGTGGLQDNGCLARLLREFVERAPSPAWTQRALPRYGRRRSSDEWVYSQPCADTSRSSSFLHPRPGPARIPHRRSARRPLFQRKWSSARCSSGMASGKSRIRRAPSRRRHRRSRTGPRALHRTVWIEAARSFNQALRTDPELALAGRSQPRTPASRT